MSPRSLHHAPCTHPQLYAEGLGRFYCRLLAEKQNQRKHASPAHKSSAAHAPQEAAQRLSCIHCPSPLGPREHLSLVRRHWREHGTSRCGRGGKTGEMVAPLGSLPISSRKSLHLASKPGEKCKLQETNNGLCMKYFHNHLLFRCIYQDNHDNV